MHFPLPSAAPLTRPRGPANHDCTLSSRASDTHSLINGYINTLSVVGSEELSIRGLLDDEVAFCVIPSAPGLGRLGKEAPGFIGMYAWSILAIVILNRLTC